MFKWTCGNKYFKILSPVLSHGKLHSMTQQISTIFTSFFIYFFGQRKVLICSVDCFLIKTSFKFVILSYLHAMRKRLIGAFKKHKTIDLVSCSLFILYCKYIFTMVQTCIFLCIPRKDWDNSYSIHFQHDNYCHEDHENPEKYSFNNKMAVFMSLDTKAVSFLIKFPISNRGIP